jgi:N-acetylglucosamine malate deacetylase 1
MNVLCVAPHPDDESIGCGGALALHGAAGDQTASVFLTSGELGLKRLPKEEAWRVRENEAAAAAKILDIQQLEFFRFPDWVLGDHVSAAAKRLAEFLRSFTPDLIYFPHSKEWHPDHKAAALIVQTALQTFGRSVELRGYEIWTPIQQHDHVLDITSVWERKISAVRSHASQIADWPYERAVQGLNQYRGAMAGRCPYAEVFTAPSIDKTAERAVVNL